MKSLCDYVREEYGLVSKWWKYACVFCLGVIVICIITILSFLGWL